MTNKLKWYISAVDGGWKLKVNNDLTIELYNDYGVWQVWIVLNDEFERMFSKIGDYEYIEDAKEKGLRVAKAIIKY